MNQNNEASDDDIGIEGDLLESRDDAPTRTESAFVSENCCPTDEEESADEDDNEDGTGTLPLKAIKSRFFSGSSSSSAGISTSSGAKNPTDWSDQSGSTTSVGHLLQELTTLDRVIDISVHDLTQPREHWEEAINGLVAAPSHAPVTNFLFERFTSGTPPKPIARGSFGKVYLVKGDIGNEGDDLAVKEVYLGGSSQEEADECMKQCLKEIQILSNRLNKLSAN